MLNILYFSQKILSEERTEKFNEPRLTQAFIFDNNSNSHLTDMQAFVDPIQKVQFCIVSEFVNAALANQQIAQYNEAPTSGRKYKGVSMGEGKYVTLADYDTLLTHVADRIVDFYIILNAAKKHSSKNIGRLKRLHITFSNKVKSIGLNDCDMVELHAGAEIWDSFQTNFSFNRKSIKKSDSKDQTEKYNALWELIHSMTKDQALIQRYNNAIDDFKYILWIRIVDIIEAPSIREILNTLNSAKNERNQIKKENRTTWQNMRIHTSQDMSKSDTTTCNNQIKALSFYPERLRPGIHYIYPKLDGITNPTLGLSIHCGASQEDIQETFAEFPYHFARYKNQSLYDEDNFVEVPEIEKIKPLLEKKVKYNKYIKQANSIEKTLVALLIWEEIELRGCRNFDAAFTMCTPSTWIDANQTKEHVDNLKKQLCDNSKKFQTK